MKNYVLASLALLAALLSMALLMETSGVKTAVPQAPRMSSYGDIEIKGGFEFEGMVFQVDSKRMVKWTFTSGVSPGSVKKDKPLLSFYTKSPKGIYYSGIRGSSVFLNEGGSGETLVGADGVFPMKNAPRSTGAWIKTRASHQPTVINWGREGHLMRNSLMVSLEGKIMLGCIGGDFTGTTPVNDGQWHLLVMTYDGKTAKLYVDGNLDASRDIELNTTPTGRCEVGSVRGEASFFTGMIDSVFVSNYVLSAVEIQEMEANRPIH